MNRREKGKAMREQSIGSAFPESADPSGAGRLVGYFSRLPEDMTGVCELEIGPQHLNRLGLLHGGFISMLLDNGCGLAVLNCVRSRGETAVTMTLSVSFIAGVAVGRVKATGRVTGGGQNVQFAAAELHDDNGRLLATATGSFRIIKGS
ncbi:PaaI family thioesterase [Paracoccus sp. SCSIO 75233]|uniref:PaaI family thioesterase n=1 Tax=Paracoccus sp. SCSIO 75233 TaxID=3017782 RepID=UPI0022F013D4|nr:PaaI family thioesterase [Paracoccus sp. SCSIO 75233]WBU53921.1 PaaI family thioesterase [Paracoccus sp. SCSIO 75233]